MELIANQRCFDGEQRRYRHRSETLQCDMVFSVFLPPAAVGRAPESVPVLYWLSGLTCTDENFVTKAGAQRYAAEYGVAIVAPDTSPRGDTVPDDPDGAYDFGLGAGFYVDATEAPWSQHYRMYSYVSDELPRLINEQLPVDADRVGIFGHSMGGHGALVLGLRNPEQFRSISAFSPIVNPSVCPWGQKALGQYLGQDSSLWQQYDATELVLQTAARTPILIDQGMADNFLGEQLKTRQFIAACEQAGYPATIRMQAGYDHSYYFIASFIEEHIGFHAAALVD